MDIGDWLSEKTGNLVKGFGKFAAEQAINAGKGMKEGLMGPDSSASSSGAPSPGASSSSPASTEQENDEPWLTGVFKSLAGGAKNNWLSILVGLISAFTLGKGIGDWIPGGWKSTLATMVVVGGLGALLVNHFTGAAKNDGTKVEPVARVDIKTGPAQKIEIAPLADRNFGHPAPEPG